MHNFCNFRKNTPIAWEICDMHNRIYFSDNSLDAPDNLPTARQDWSQSISRLKLHRYSLFDNDSTENIEISHFLLKHENFDPLAWNNIRQQSLHIQSQAYSIETPLPSEHTFPCQLWAVAGLFRENNKKRENPLRRVSVVAPVGRTI